MPLDMIPIFKYYRKRVQLKLDYCAFLVMVNHSAAGCEWAEVSQCFFFFFSGDKMNNLIIHFYSFIVVSLLIASYNNKYFFQHIWTRNFHVLPRCPSWSIVCSHDFFSFVAPELSETNMACAFSFILILNRLICVLYLKRNNRRSR